MRRGCGYEGTASGEPSTTCDFSWRKPSSRSSRQAALEERAGVHARGGVPLEEDLVAAAGVVLAAEEVVEADLVEGGRRGVRGDVAADPDAGALGAVHDHRGVPAQVRAEAPLGLLVAGEPGLLLGADRVDVVGGRQRRHADLLGAGALEHAQHEVAGAHPAGAVDDGVEAVEPLLGLGGVDVRQVRRDAVEDGADVFAGGHAVVLSTMTVAHREERAPSHLSPHRRRSRNCVDATGRYPADRSVSEVRAAGRGGCRPTGAAAGRTRRG